MIAAHPLMLSAEGRALLTAKEGNYSQVYDDGIKSGDKRISSYAYLKGAPTIGIGHRIQSKERPTYTYYLKGKSQLSEAQIQALLNNDLLKVEMALRERIHAPVTQAMVDAILIQTFNTGTGTDTYKKVVRLINEGKYEEAHYAMYEAPKTAEGVIVEGLKKRRQQEMDLFGSQGYPSNEYSDTGSSDTGNGDTGYYDTGYLTESRPSSMPRWVIPMLLASGCCMSLLAALRIRRNMKLLNS